jgi:membrane protease YdiL (CAAX protease family)
VQSPEPATPAPRTARWRAPSAVGAVVAGLLAGQAAAAGIVIAAGGRDASSELTGLALVVGDLVLLAVIVLAARRGAERLSAATLGIRRTRFWPAAGWMFALLFTISAFAALWSVLVGGFEGNDGAGGGSLSTGAALLLLLGVAVTAPIVEEIAFRGYLFPALTHWRGPWIAALATAILFGAAHVASAPLVVLPVLAFFGFGACLLFWFTGSLLPCIALHAINNALVIGAGAEWTWQVPVGIAGATALALGLLAPFARERAPQAA